MRDTGTANVNKSISSTSSTVNVKNTLVVLFITLLIDLLSFTIILPLFPTLLTHYYQIASSTSPLSVVYTYLSQLRTSSPAITITGTNHLLLNSTLETTLIGGILGSIYSLLQFLVSPYIGKLADKYGRRNILLLSVFLNLISSLIWCFSSNFYLFFLSRVVAGLSEGNVQLATTIISDITPIEKRTRYMALIGIAFGLAFTIGPAMGGYMVSKSWFTSLTQLPYSHPYLTASILATSLLLLELIVIYLYLPETKPNLRNNQTLTDKSKSKSRLDRVTTLKPITFLFLFLFSGLEFTLPFLTYALYDYTPIEQGKLFAAVGTVSVLFQSVLVRRFGDKIGSINLVKLGLLSCLFTLITLAYLAYKPDLYFGMGYVTLSLACTSATVVNGLNSLASTLLQTSNSNTDANFDIKNHIDPHNESLAQDLGKFRAYGQLGRCFGPIAVSALYWYQGPTKCYLYCSVSILLLIGWFFNLKVDANRIKKD